MEGYFTTLLGFFLGGIGWWIANFFGKPLYDFFVLRREIREALTYSDNLDYRDHTGAFSDEISESDKNRQQRYFRAEEDLRRLAAKLEGVRITKANCLLKRIGYDLKESAGRLIAFSNVLDAPYTLDNRKGCWRYFFKNEVERKLGLGQTVDKEIMKLVREKLFKENTNG